MVQAALSTVKKPLVDVGLTPVDEKDSLNSQQNQGRLAAFAFSAADILIEFDASLKIVFAAGVTSLLTADNPENLHGRLFIDLIDPPDRDRVMKIIAQAGIGRRFEIYDIRLNGCRGPTNFVSLTGYFLPEPGGRYLVSVRFVSLPNRVGRSRGLVRHTEIGLYDLETFAFLCGEKLYQERSLDESYTISILDIGGLNNYARHLDPSRREVFWMRFCETLKSASLGGDLAACLGPEKYALLHVTEMNPVVFIRCIEGIVNDLGAGKDVIMIESCRIPLDSPAFSLEDAIRAAKHAIRRIIQETRAGPVSENFQTTATAVREEVEREISEVRDVISDENFNIVFQPVVNLSTGTIRYFEVLSRFRGHLSEASPFAFIRLAESTGMVNALDLAICKCALNWLRGPEARDKNCRIAVNLSAQSVQDPRFIGRLLKMLAEHNDVRNRMQFELTESAAVENLETVSRVIADLRRLGHRFALDDFGTGEMALRGLRAFDVDIVKIDGSYIRNATEGGKNRVFLKAIVGLTNDLGIETVAEMVETQETVDFLKRCGVDYGQGYFFGAPNAKISAFNNFPCHPN